MLACRASCMKEPVPGGSPRRYQRRQKPPPRCDRITGDPAATNSGNVFGYATGLLLTCPYDRNQTPMGTPPRRGEMDALASSPLPPPPHSCVRYHAKPADYRFAIGARHGPSESFRLVKSDNETRSRDFEGRARA